jgi:PKD repeat protein
MKMYMKNVMIATFLLLGVFLVGCDDDEGKTVPEIVPDFNFTIEDEDGTVNFINNTENALSYEWNFGDGSTITEEINPTHVYAASGTYTVELTAINKESDSKSITADVTILVFKAVSLPNNFDEVDVRYEATAFGGTSFEVVDNPDLSGVNNTTTKVGKITNIGENFEGISFNLGTPIDLSTEMSITMKFWSNKPINSILVKLENGTAGNIETGVSHGGTGWEMIKFNFNSTESYSTLTIFADFNVAAAGTFYFDDISQTETGDITAPTITLNGNAVVGIIVGDSFTDPGATAVDDVDGDLSPSIVVAGDNVDVNTIGAYVITYNVSDATGNAATEVTRTVNIQAADVIAPVITLNGASTINLTIGDAFTDPGATASDNFDGDITANIAVAGDAVDVNTVGTYVITYNVSDAAGNAATEVTRSVIVSAGGVACGDSDLKLPMDFDCSNVTYDFVEFNGATDAIVDNPFLTGINATASKVLQITNSGANWEGGAFTLANAVDFSTDKKITMKVHSTVAVPVLLKFEGAGAPTEISANHGGTGWEQLTFEFTSSDQFNVLVIFVDGPGNTAGSFYFDDIEQVGDVCTDTDLKLPMDFDCVATTYDFVEFNGATDAIVDNPFLTGINATASKVLQITNSGANWEGGAFTLANAVDFSTDKAIKMKVHSTVGVPVLLKFEGAGAPTEISANHGGTGWEELTFTFTSSDQFNTLVIFVDGPGNTAGDFYFDDIEQTTAGGGGGGTTCPPPAGDLVSNGGFETGDDCGWDLFDNGGFASIDNTVNNGGSFSAKMSTSGPSNPGIKQERIGAGTVKDGDVIQIKFDHIGTIVPPGGVFNVLLFGEGAAGASFTEVLNPGALGSTWQTYTGTFTIPTGTDVSEGISFLIQSVCGGDAGCSVSANIDNVSVTLNP